MLPINNHLIIEDSRLKQQSIVILLALVLILTITTLRAHEKEGLGYEILPVQENAYLSNEVHVPIRILNDSQLLTQAENEMWEGDGSESTPFIIDAYNISSETIGIQVCDVSLYFMIRDCYLESVGGKFSEGVSEGILLNNVSHGIVRGTTVTGMKYGIHISINCTVNIEGCTITDCTIAAIHIIASDNCRIDNCELYSCNLGIFGIWLEAPLIEGNKIWNNTETGITLAWGAGGGTSLILNNEIYDNRNTGISILGEADPGSQDYVVDNNILHHNDGNGINVEVGSQVNITNNIVYDNLIGVNVVSSTPSWIFGNDIGWNLLENAADQSSVDNNYWHDNVSVGNWWSDYSGMGDYIITAFVGPGAYDIFPKKSLDLNASLPIAYEISETGNTMSWDAYALNPSHYEVYANDILLFSEEWDGGHIETNLDGLSAGKNEIMVIAYHFSGHSTNETAIAEVTDLTPSGGLDPVMLTVLGVSAGVIILIIAMVAYVKKRGY